MVGRQVAESGHFRSGVNSGNSGGTLWLEITSVALQLGEVKGADVETRKEHRLQKLSGSSGLGPFLKISFWLHSPLAGPSGVLTLS